MSSNNPRTIAILGGTGKEGKGLAFRWAQAGHSIIIGSRTSDKALAAVEEVKALIAKPVTITGKDNNTAAREAEIVVLTVPYAFHKEMLEAIKTDVQGKLFIDVTVPIVPPKVTRVQMPPEGSASQQAQLILGENVRVVAAFQNISYENLLSSNTVDCDVLVAGGDKDARGQVVSLVRDAGLMGIDAGPIDNAVVIEGLTSILIGINKQFGVEASGIRITGIPRE